jgi:SsrA-binding protein
LELKGLTLVPLRIYFNNRGIAKVTIGLAKGKTVGDKREAMKAREHAREMQRAMRGRKS